MDSRTQFEEYILEKTLHFKNLHCQGGDFPNGCDPVENIESPGLRNVCAKLSVALSDSIDKRCELLGISKRRFIEGAIVDALAMSERVWSEVGIDLDEVCQEVK